MHSLNLLNTLRKVEVRNVFNAAGIGYVKVNESRGCQSLKGYYSEISGEK